MKPPLQFWLWHRTALRGESLGLVAPTYFKRPTNFETVEAALPLARRAEALEALIVEHNHAAYVSDHHVAASTAVQHLAKI